MAQAGRAAMDVSICSASAMAFAVLGYGTCSSLMLVVNKLAVHFLPAPSFLLFMQFFTSWVAVKLCGMCGLCGPYHARAVAKVMKAAQPAGPRT